jgi:hypothetical protein
VSVIGTYVNYNCAISQKVILKALPPGFLDDLPLEDQQAVSKAVGKPVGLNGYEDDGRAELEFTDIEGVIHILYVDPKFIQKACQ